nr:hypothetical protein [Tanacetum cinerariifolium]
MAGEDRTSLLITRNHLLFRVVHKRVGPTLQVNRWIRYAITRNVQEIDLRITDPSTYASCDDELFFNNSCLISMKLSGCGLNPPNGTIHWDKLKCLCIDRWTLDEDLIGTILSGSPCLETLELNCSPNGAIRWDKLKCLCIDQGGILYEDLIGKILSGSPCLETLELNCCQFDGRIPMSLSGNFGVLELLSCDLETCERLSYNDVLLGDESLTPITPNGAIRWDKLKCLCIDQGGILYEDLIGKILSGSPCLETLELNCCQFDGRIPMSLSGNFGVLELLLSYRNNAPYILSLTIKGNMYMEELLLQNVSSLVKADLNYHGSYYFADDLGRDEDDIEEEFIRGLLSSLGHANEIALGDAYCLQFQARGSV